ncbi:MAG: RodZ domain-containing protein [Colwellia sp.]
MINAVDSTGKVSDDELGSVAEKKPEKASEPSKDMDSPGVMLSEARKGLSLSQEHIANKLKFNIAFVNNIEQDRFSPTMPATFIRGYLVNYAKLVDVDVEDVLASYDALNIATTPRSEMLSFSREISKQAEHSRVMWLSYFIMAVLVGLTVLWWLQESKPQEQNSLSFVASTALVNTEDNKSLMVEKSTAPTDVTTAKGQANNNLNKNETNAAVVIENSTEQGAGQAQVNHIDESSNLLISDALEPAVLTMSTAVFTFKGDCWVNIHDATGRRIAWGVKEAGYVMTIQGLAPLRITVGKPELTSIVFNGQAVDMSIFNTGNIAKFSLPIGE